MVSTLLVTLGLGAAKIIALPDLKSIFQPGYQVVTVVDDTGKVPLALLPHGAGSGLDADTLDGFKADIFAKESDLLVVANDVSTLKGDVKTLNATVSAPVVPLNTINGIAGDMTIAAGNGISVTNGIGKITITNTGSATAGVSSLTGGGGVTVSAGTGSITLGTANIPYGSLSLAGTIAGSDLASNITISTSGSVSAANLTTSGSGTIRTLVLTNASNGNTLTFNQGAIGSSYAVTWPTAQASGTQFLQNDGSGNLTWATPSASCVTCVQLVPTTTPANTIAPTAASVVALTVKGTTGTSANVLELFDSTATPTRQSYFDGTAALNTAKQIVSTVTTGTAPFSVASTTNVANLNASSLGGATFSAPGAIGGGTAAAGTFTTLTANTSIGTGGNISLTGASPTISSSNASIFTISSASNQNIAISPGGTGSITSTLANLTGNGVSWTNLSLTTGSAEGITFKNNSGAAAGNTASGLTISQTPAANTGNTSDLVNLSASGVAVGTVNGIEFTGTLTNLTNLISAGASGATFKVTSAGAPTFAGAITAPTSTNTINSVIINSGAVSGVTTLGLSGAITGATATNTINSLVINAGALSGITTLSMSGQLTSTLATGTAPFSVASTTNVPNLNASSLNGATFAAPGAIGGGTASTGAFTSITTSSTINTNTFSSTALTFAGASPNISASTVGTSLTINANGAGTITLASSSTGQVQFFSSSNAITSAGALTIAGGITSSAGNNSFTSTSAATSTFTLAGTGTNGAMHLKSTQATLNTETVSGTGFVAGTVTAGSTDTAGQFAATVGTTGGTVILAFKGAYGANPFCVVSPASATAQVDFGKAYVTTGTTALTLNIITGATGGSETWNYFCAE